MKIIVSYVNKEEYEINIPDRAIEDVVGCLLDSVHTSVTEMRAKNE